METKIFYFCLQYVLAIYLYDLSLLKIILKSTFYCLLKGKVHLLLFTVSTITHALFLGYPYIMFFNLHFFMYLMPYTLSSCFHSVKSTLQMVTSIHTIHKRITYNQNLGIKMEAARRFKAQEIERERNRVSKKKSLRKKNRKGIQRKKLLIHHVKVILIVLLKNMSHQKLNILVLSTMKYHLLKFFNKLK